MRGSLCPVTAVLRRRGWLRAPSRGVPPGGSSGDMLAAWAAHRATCWPPVVPPGGSSGGVHHCGQNSEGRRRRAWRGESPSVGGPPQWTVQRPRARSGVRRGPRGAGLAGSPAGWATGVDRQRTSLRPDEGLAGSPAGWATGVDSRPAVFRSTGRPGHHRWDHGPLPHVRSDLDDVSGQRGRWCALLGRSPVAPRLFPTTRGGHPVHPVWRPPGTPRLAAPGGPIAPGTHRRGDASPRAHLDRPAYAVGRRTGADRRPCGVRWELAGTGDAHPRRVAGDRTHGRRAGSARDRLRSNAGSATLGSGARRRTTDRDAGRAHRRRPLLDRAVQAPGPDNRRYGRNQRPRHRHRHRHGLPARHVGRAIRRTQSRGGERPCH